MDSFYSSGVCAPVSLPWVMNRHWAIDTDMLPKQRNAVFLGTIHQCNHSLVFQILSSLWLLKLYSSATQGLLKRCPAGTLRFSVWFWGGETSVSSTANLRWKGSWSHQSTWDPTRLLRTLNLLYSWLYKQASYKVCLLGGGCAYI